VTSLALSEPAGALGVPALRGGASDVVEHEPALGARTAALRGGSPRTRRRRGSLDVKRFIG
jgi:hypothetical protein